MTTTTVGLDAIATEAGTFAVLAMDQRGTLRRMLAAVDRPTPPTRRSRPSSGT